VDLTCSQTKIIKKSILDTINPELWRSSTKIEALMEALYTLFSKPDQTVKAIVFSQFV
jgi:hypothetical protein